MAAPSPVITAAIAESGLVKNSLLQAMIEHIPYVLGVSEVLADLQQNAGLIYRVIHWQKTGYAYYYAPADTTTPDDGETVIVDADGHRYHLAASSDVQVNSVLAVQDTPPGSPVENDAYIVGTSPTGVWAAHANDIAIYLLSGWVFAEPKVGHTLYVEGQGNLQFDENGDWTTFVADYADGTISNTALVYPFGIAVEATQNAPPVSPATGLFYIVGDSPTGAWSGHAKDVAEWGGAAWKFYDPYVGASVYHRALGYRVAFSAANVWANEGGSSITTYSTPGSFSMPQPAGGNRAKVELWAGGGSGGRAGSGDGGGGGGGGSYFTFEMNVSDIAWPVSITVGAGGAAITTDDVNGITGGNSSFGSYATAYGGGGGVGVTSDDGGGGGGGGEGGPGSIGTTTTGGAGGIDVLGAAAAGGVSNANGAASMFGGGGGGGGGTTTAGTGGASRNGGGGGGGGNDGTTAGPGGASVFGGGGGGGNAGTTAGLGGVSRLAGNGGAGSVGNAVATAGAQPAGGGGGSRQANSGKGGDGLVRVTVW